MSDEMIKWLPIRRQTREEKAMQKVIDRVNQKIRDAFAMPGMCRLPSPPHKETET